MREMDIKERYSIDYQSLQNGVYALDMEVDASLFEAMESNEIKGGECRVRVELAKSESGIDTQVSIEGEVVVECDRCLEDCTVPVDFEGELKVRFSDDVSDYDGEQMWIAWGERLSLAQYIYESIVISLPYRRVHADGECNPEMMSRFTPYTEVPAEDGE